MRSDINVRVITPITFRQSSLARQAGLVAVEPKTRKYSNKQTVQYLPPGLKPATYISLFSRDGFLSHRPRCGPQFGQRCPPQQQGGC